MKTNMFFFLFYRRINKQQMRCLRNSHGRSIISQHWSPTRSTGRVSPLMATSGTWIMNFYLETYVACSLTSFYLRILPFGVAFRKILMFPKNDTVDGLVIHLLAYDSANLPQGRRITASVKLSVINQRISTLTKTIGISSSSSSSLVYFL